MSMGYVLRVNVIYLYIMYIISRRRRHGVIAFNKRGRARV